MRWRTTSGGGGGVNRATATNRSTRRRGPGPRSARSLGPPPTPDSADNLPPLPPLLYRFGDMTDDDATTVGMSRQSSGRASYSSSFLSAMLRPFSTQQQQQQQHQSVPTPSSSPSLTATAIAVDAGAAPITATASDGSSPDEIVPESKKDAQDLIEKKQEPDARDGKKGEEERAIIQEPMTNASLLAAMPVPPQSCVLTPANRTLSVKPRGNVTSSGTNRNAAVHSRIVNRGDPAAPYVYIDLFEAYGNIADNAKDSMDRKMSFSSKRPKTAVDHHAKERSVAERLQFTEAERRRQTRNARICAVATICLVAVIIIIPCSIFLSFFKHSSSSSPERAIEVPTPPATPWLVPASGGGTATINGVLKIILDDSYVSSNLPGGVIHTFSPTNIGRYELAPSPSGNGSGVVAIHAALQVNTSKIVFVERWDFEGTNASFPDGRTAWSVEYDYRTNEFRPLTLRTNVFCAAGGVAPDGRVLMVGGAEAHRGLGDGTHGIRLISPSGDADGDFGTADWIDDQNDATLQLGAKRWYPTTAALPDGRIIVVGGSNVAVEFNNYTSNTPSFEFIPRANLSDDPASQMTPLQLLNDTVPANLYPMVSLLPSGRLFVFAGNRSTLLDPTTDYNPVVPFRITPTDGPAAGSCLQSDNATSLFFQPCTTDPWGDRQNVTHGKSPQGFVTLSVGEPEAGTFRIYNAFSRLCITLSSAKNPNATYPFILQRCANDSNQVFTWNELDGLMNVATSSCLTIVKNDVESGPWHAAFMECGAGDPGLQSLKRLPSDAYFEFPVLQGPQRSYPWTAASLLLPLDPNENYDPKIIICGGSFTSDGNQSSTATTLSTCGTMRPDLVEPYWDMGDNMTSPRVMGDMVQLPDGTVLLVNGCKLGMAGWDLGREPNLQASVFTPSNPRGSRWMNASSTSIPRMYHSVAVLLPDGRVLIAGSSPNAPTVPTPGHAFEKEHRVEYYIPHYLTANLPRPAVASLSSYRWDYATSVSVQVSLNGTVERHDPATPGRLEVNIMHSGLRTHSTGFSQRLVWLVVRGTGGDTIMVETPPNPRIAPPGWYMMFVVWNGVPSEAVWVQCGGDPAGFASLK